MKTPAKKVLIIVSGFIPSTIIGVMRPLAALEQLGEVRLRLRLYNLPALLSSDIDWCDIAVFSRNCEMRDLPALYELKRKGKAVVYDIDDNFEEIPLTNDIGVYHRMFFRLHVIKRFFQFSDVTRVYSESMARLASQRQGQPFLSRSYFDAGIVHGAKKAASNGKIKIAYPTGRLDDPALEEMFYRAVRVILERHPGKVEFHLWRKTTPAQLSGVPGVVLNAGVPGYEKFMLSFYKAGFDIGLAPGINTPFFHSKTNNKYREFGGCGIAGIYGNFPPYSNTLQNEHNALLVESSTEAWVAAIERLISSPELRERIANNALADVTKNYSFESELEGWRKVIAMAEKGRPLDTEWLPQPRQIPNIAVLDLLPNAVVGGRPAEQTKTDRLTSLDAVVEAMPYASAAFFRNIVDFLHYPSRRSFCSVLYLVDNRESLTGAMQVIALSNSAIVDLSNYSDDLISAARLIEEATSGVPTILLVSSAQSGLLSNLPDMHCVIFSIDLERAGSLQRFSVEGYAAVYLDLIERQVQYGTVLRSRRYARIATAKRRVSTFYRRASTVMKYVKWRLGGREF